MLIASLFLAGAAPAADAAALPSGDSAAWRATMLDWSAEPVSPVNLPSLRMEKPVAAGRLSSVFGVRSDPMTGSWRAHRGVDIAAPAGTPIVASSDGIVSFAGHAGGYGALVQIDHPSGMQTRYGHLSRILARRGDVVRRGDVIGAMGSTGRSTGSHLHYEVRIEGLAVDPSRPLPLARPAPSAEPTLPVTPRWQGWTIAADRLPSAF